MKKTLTLNSLKRNEEFLKFYEKFLFEELDLGEQKRYYLLSFYF